MNIDTNLTFTLTASISRQCINVSATQDNYPEYDEGFIVSAILINPLDSLVAPQRALVRIIDDDGESTLMYRTLNVHS